MSPAAGESRGRGVSISTRSWGSNRPCPHAQIFFPSAKPLIIFFESKKSNGGALSSAQQYKPSQALRRRVLGRRRRAGWKSGIYFRSQFVRPRGAVKSSVDPGSRTAWLIRTRNREIKYRKPTACRLRTPRGIKSLAPCRPGTVARQAGTHFLEIRKTFFVCAQAPWAWARLKNVAKFRVGGVGSGT